VIRRISVPRVPVGACVGVYHLLLGFVPAPGFCRGGYWALSRFDPCARVSAPKFYSLPDLLGGAVHMAGARWRTAGRERLLTRRCFSSLDG